MADNTIKTKILLACDTLANWTGSTRVLSKGEIALAITTDNKVQVRVGHGVSGCTFTNALPIDISQLADTLTLSASQVKLVGSETTVDAAIKALQSSVETLNGDASKDGSVAKAIKDALADYTTTAVLTANYATKAELTAETQARTAADEVLRTAIDNKIFIEGVSAEALSIATVSPEKYSEILNSGGNIPSNQLYIVSANYLYAYDKAIKNVGDGVVATDAATVGQLSTVSADLNTKIEGVNVNSLSAGIATALAGTFDAKGSAATAKTEAITAANAYTDTAKSEAISSANAYTDTEIGKINTSLTSLNVTVEKQVTAAEGFAATYIVKQGGTQVGEAINIPKDFLVKSGEVKTCEADNSPVTGYKKGDKYLDFVVNTVTDDETAKHIYIKLTDLVDVYTAAQGATEVQVAIDEHNVVSASLVDGGVATAKLANAAVTTDKIADTAVTTAKINAAAVTEEKIADTAVTTGKIAATAVTEEKLAVDSVTTAKIKDASVTAAKLSGEFVFDCGNATA